MTPNSDLLCSPLSWEHWEDIPAGLWNEDDSRSEMIESSQILLSHPLVFEQTANLMVDAWNVTACAHLSDRRRGRRAWIGQASCCFAHGATRWETIAAWLTLPARTRDLANEAALQVIIRWERHAAAGSQYALFP